MKSKGLVLFFAMIFCAGSIAQEKDRRTLLLLLMTDLSARELVLGKLGASLLIVMVLIGVSAPVFFLVHLLGGVGWEQIAWVLALCVAVAVAAVHARGYGHLDIHPGQVLVDLALPELEPVLIAFGCASP